MPREPQGSPTSLSTGGAASLGMSTLQKEGQGARTHWMKKQLDALGQPWVWLHSERHSPEWQSR